MTMVVPKLQTINGSPFFTLKEFLNTERPASQLFRFNNLEGAILHAAKGTQLVFEPGAFVNHWGNPVDEEIYLEVDELNSRKDFFWTGKMTTAGNRPMDTIGILNIKMKEGTQTGLILQKPVLVELPVHSGVFSLSALGVYQESTARTRIFPAQDTMDWKLVDTRIGLVKRKGITNYLRFQVSDLSCFACCKIIRHKPAKTTMISVRTVSPVEQLEDQRAFLILRKSRTILELFRHNDKFSAFNLPAGEQATLLVLGVAKGDLFWGKQQIFALSNRVIVQPLEKISESHLRKNLKQMVF